MGGTRHDATERYSAALLFSRRQAVEHLCRRKSRRRRSRPFASNSNVVVCKPVRQVAQVFPRPIADLNISLRLGYDVGLRFV